MEKTGRHAFLVGAGILLTRVAGLFRQSVFFHYFGVQDADQAFSVSDVFSTALRIPNVLQNLFGEGALSASFIPVYSRLLAEGETMHMILDSKMKPAALPENYLKAFRSAIGK